MPNHIPVHDADWFKYHFWQLYFKADWLEIHFLSASLFSLQQKTCRFYLVYMCEEALGSKVIWNVVKGERNIKAAEKDPSATVVASVHSTSPTPVGSVNATEFWQRWTQPPTFLLLLSHKMDLAIPEWSTLCPGSQMICDNYLSVYLLPSLMCCIPSEQPQMKLRLFQKKLQKR